MDEKQVQINNALRYFEPLSRRKINIFKKVIEFEDEVSTEDWMDLVFKWINEGRASYLLIVNTGLNPSDFQWMKGMGHAHAMRMCEICYELERAGCSYIIEGKLKKRKVDCYHCGGCGYVDIKTERGVVGDTCEICHGVGWRKVSGRPDITVLWYPLDKPGIFDFLGHKIPIKLQAYDQPFHIEVIDSEVELNEHKVLNYPFEIVAVKV